jgi:hypothetical protein
MHPSLVPCYHCVGAQVLAGLNEEERLSYGLTKKAYNYLGLSTDDTEDESVLDYAAFFTQVRRALSNLGFTEGEASVVLRTIVAILNLGEVEFESDASGDAVISEMPVSQLRCPLLPAGAWVGKARGLCTVDGFVRTELRKDGDGRVVFDVQAVVVVLLVVVVVVVACVGVGGPGLSAGSRAVLVGQLPDWQAVWVRGCTPCQGGVCSLACIFVCWRALDTVGFACSCDGLEWHAVLLQLPVGVYFFSGCTILFQLPADRGRRPSRQPCSVHV